MKVEDIKKNINEKVELICVLKKISKNKGSNCKNYLSINVGDATGEINGTMFSDYFNDGDEKNFKSGMAVKIFAQVRDYKGSANLNITGIEEIEMTQEQLLEFIPSISNEEKAMYIEELNEFIGLIKDAELSKLISGVVTDYNEKITVYPSAKGHHHNYLGGLLEHTVAVTRNCITLGKNYDLDTDLLVAGGILHDIGKIFEYDYKKGEIERTESGVLLHHISLGLMFLSSYITKNEIKLSNLMKTKLFHMIISHHGKNEYQTPVEPKFIEAFILSQADMIDFMCNHNKMLIKEKGNGEPFIWDNLCKDWVYIK